MECPSDSPALRLLRSLRVVRLMRLVRRFPSLDRLVLAVTHPIVLIVNICIVLTIMLYIYAGVGVALFGGATSRAAFPRPDGAYAHFGDAWHALVLLFVMATGEKWAEVTSRRRGGRARVLGRRRRRSPRIDAGSFCVTIRELQGPSVS